MTQAQPAQQQLQVEVGPMPMTLALPHWEIIQRGLGKLLQEESGELALHIALAKKKHIDEAVAAAQAKQAAANPPAPAAPPGAKLKPLSSAAKKAGGRK